MRNEVTEQAEDRARGSMSHIQRSIASVRSLAATVTTCAAGCSRRAAVVDGDRKLCAKCAEYEHRKRALRVEFADRPRLLKCMLKQAAVEFR